MWGNIKASLVEIRGHGRRGQLQLQCFFLTFMAHGSSFVLRKALAVIKHDLSNSMEISLPFLSWLDTALLLPIAVIQIFFVNSMTDVSPRKVLAGSLMFSSLALATVGIWHTYLVYIGLLLLGGAFQALIFPYCITALNAWYPAGSKSSVFGIWGICVFLGGIMGTLISVLARIVVGWEYVFLVVSAIVCLSGLPLFWLRMPSGTTQRPAQVIPKSAAGDTAGGAGGSAVGPNSGSASKTEVLLRADTFSQTDRAMTAEEEQDVVSAGVYVIDRVPEPRRLGAAAVARIDMVKDVAAAYFCVNVIRYVFSFDEMHVRMHAPSPPPRILVDTHAYAHTFPLE